MGAIIETRQLTHTYSQGTPFERTALTVDECAGVLKELLA